MINFPKFKKFFLFSLIGALIVSAIVAVITVLTGEFNQTTSRVLITLLMVVVHSLISLAFVWDDSKSNNFYRLSFFTNIIFLIIVFSFITSVLGIWEIISAKIVGKLYQTYMLVGLVSLHSDILSKALKKEKYMDAVIYFNYVFIGIIFLMILPIIYINDLYQFLGERYYRILGAAGIIDGTASILTIILYKLHLHKHPEEHMEEGELTNPDPTQKGGMGFWTRIFIIYLVFQLISTIFSWIMGSNMLFFR